ENEIYFRLDGTASPCANSVRGQPSIDVFALNEKDKVRARSQEQYDGFQRYLSRISAVSGGLTNFKRVAQEVKDEYYSGDRPYAAAVFDSIHFYLEKSPLDPDVLLAEAPNGGGPTTAAPGDQ